VPWGWWPPLMLEPGWVSDNHDRFDVFHVHFGFDAIEPRALTDVMQELKEHGKPLLYTMHDLRQPSRRFVIGVHAKSLRANMDPLPLIDELTRIVSALPKAILQIDVHDEIFDPANYWFAPQAGKALLQYDRHEHVAVRVHSYFSDDELWDYLASLTVSLLPYRFGTHSGWLEACFDLGTAVIAPSCGYYHQQRPCGVFEFTEDSFNAESLRHAVDDAYRRWEAGRPAPRASWQARWEERIELAAAHRRLYEYALR
jgi:hypothetical protein